MQTHPHAPDKINFLVVLSPCNCTVSGSNVRRWKKHNRESGTLKQPTKGLLVLLVGHLLSSDLYTQESPHLEPAFPKVIADRKELPSRTSLAELGAALHYCGWEQEHASAAPLQYRGSTYSYRISHRNAALCLDITLVSIPGTTG